MRTGFLYSKNISLRPLSLEDVSGNYRYWLNDPEIVAYNSHGRFPITEEKLIHYVNNANTSQAQIILAIVEHRSQTHIGNISLQRINWIDRNAEIAFLLGEKKFWGKGIMFEAGQLLMAHGFHTLNLHRIYCGTSSANIGMQKLAKKFGMRQEGIQRQAIYTQAIYHDIIQFGILKTEFNNIEDINK